MGLHTWALDAAHATPYLVILSPTKRSGKTRLEETLELLVRDPVADRRSLRVGDVPQDRRAASDPAPR